MTETQATPLDRRSVGLSAGAEIGLLVGAEIEPWRDGRLA